MKAQLTFVSVAFKSIKQLQKILNKYKNLNQEKHMHP